MSFEQKEYFLSGKRAERERIIKLLIGMRTGYMFQDAECEYDAIGEAIALIEGEK